MSNKHSKTSVVQELIAQLIVDFLWSEATFESFVNHLEYNLTLDGSAHEMLLISLSQTNRAWARYARLALRKRVVVKNIERPQRGASLLELTRRNEPLGPNASYPWVREIFISGIVDSKKQNRGEYVDIASRIMCLLQACPNVQKLYLKTVYTRGTTDFDSILAQVAKLEHLRKLWLHHTTQSYLIIPPCLVAICNVLPSLTKLEKLSTVGWSLDLTLLSTIESDWGRLSPPGTLRSLAVTKPGIHRNAHAWYTLTWLFKPTHTYRPTALTISLLDLKTLPPESTSTFLTCMQSLLPSIHSLYVLDYDESIHSLLVNVLQLCCSLRNLFVIIESEGIARVVPGLFVDPSQTSGSSFPHSLQKLQIHFASGVFYSDDLHTVDSELVAQARTLPDLKEIAITAPCFITGLYIHPPMVNWDTFPISRAYYEGKGIVLNVKSSASNPTPP